MSNRTPEKDLEKELRDPQFARMFGAAQAKSSFAITLANARIKSGITQKEMAERAGVSQAYIAKLESGEANPTLERIGNLLAVIGLGIMIGATQLSPYQTRSKYEANPIYKSLTTKRKQHVYAREGPSKSTPVLKD